MDTVSYVSSPTSQGNHLMCDHADTCHMTTAMFVRFITRSTMAYLPRRASHDDIWSSGGFYLIRSNRRPHGLTDGRVGLHRTALTSYNRQIVSGLCRHVALQVASFTTLPQFQGHVIRTDTRGASQRGQSGTRHMRPIMYRGTSRVYARLVKYGVFTQIQPWRFYDSIIIDGQISTTRGRVHYGTNCSVSGGRRWDLECRIRGTRWDYYGIIMGDIWHMMAYPTLSMSMSYQNPRFIPTYSPPTNSLYRHPGPPTTIPIKKLVSS